MKVAAEYAKLIEVIRWIDECTAGLALPGDERSLLAIGCLDVTIETQAAIALLHTEKLYGAEFALVRVLVESLVRGLWLRQCASDGQLEKFKKGTLDKKFGALVSEIKGDLGMPDQALSAFRGEVWGVLNGFTHAGMHQVSRRYSEGRVTSNYSDEELASALRVAGALGLIAGAQIVVISGRKELLPVFLKHMSDYTNNAS